jgi:Flp pilus assembly protein TadG
VIRRRHRGERGQRGQGLVEFALVLPIVAVLVVSVVEIGLIYGAIQSIGYASRDAARVGAALALGDQALCPGDGDPTNVDATAVGAAQRILKSPDSGIQLPRITEIRIFKATSTGAETSGRVNVWTYAGPGAGPDVDPGVGGGNVERIDFTGPSDPAPWSACSRVNGGVTPDSIGVTVRYRYDFVTPMASVLRALAGGDLSLTLSETTVMALNPTS